MIQTAAAVWNSRVRESSDTEAIIANPAGRFSPPVSVIAKNSQVPNP